MLAATPHLIDIALSFVLLEIVALVIIRRKSGRGPQLSEAITNLASGAFLMGACRAALSGSKTQVTAWMAAALIAHAIDLRNRWYR